jgi:hypothetical protein
MRIWLDPRKLQHYGLGASDVTTSVANQNVEVPAGSVGAEPAPPGSTDTVNVHVPGQLADAKAFGDIIVKNGVDGSLVRLSQVARVELGAQDYSSTLRFDRTAALGIGIQLNSSANALAVAKEVRATLARLKPLFPKGVDYSIPYDTTLFVSESLREVIVTLLIAIVLVVVTIYLFLQDWRTTLIPIITIPVSLIGTFAFVNIFGFSINTLVLFGLTLATGLVVDDAIVVIENIARVMRDAAVGSNRREATLEGLGEIVGAVVATSVVLLAVFVPVSLMPGTTGARAGRAAFRCLPRLQCGLGAAHETVRLLLALGRARTLRHRRSTRRFARAHVRTLFHRTHGLSPGRRPRRLYWNGPSAGRCVAQRDAVRPQADRECRAREPERRACLRDRRVVVQRCGHERGVDLHHAQAVVRARGVCELGARRDRRATAGRHAYPTGASYPNKSAIDSEPRCSGRIRLRA